ncbi:MAG: hypothetical protein Q9160_002523 [Pyrenula sp. 1 TL-2023]
MECSICSLGHSDKLPFHCVTCARNSIYAPRLESARVLIDNDQLSKEIASLTKITNINDQDPDQGDGSRRWILEKRRIAAHQSKSRAMALQEHRTVLSAEIAKMKEELSQRKAMLNKRRTTLDKIRDAIPQKRQEKTESLDSKVQQQEADMNTNHRRTRESRAFLAREAATLMRLRHVRSEKRGKTLDYYSIGGIFLPDLREMNNIRPEELTTALTNLAHLLVLAAHYLAVRLPAEITLPHRAYPLPTIFLPAQSYLLQDIPFPGLATSHSSTSSLILGKHDQINKSIPRPRPLYIDQKLPKIAHEDPNQYNHFMEGVSLLAWDLAWLCRTQGSVEGTESWEEICCIGKNIYHLLGSKSTSSLSARSRHRANDAADPGSEATETPLSGNERIVKRHKSFGHLGEFSHGSTRSFLGSVEGHSLVRGWKYSRFSLVVDNLKKTLLGEMTGAEWELLDEKDFADLNQDTTDGEAVVIGRDEDKDERPNNDKPRGVSGWTKLRERPS